VINFEVQDGILYGLMVFGPDGWYEFGAGLESEMFDGERRAIFQTIAELNRAGQFSDVVMVCDRLTADARDLAADIGAIPFMSRSRMPSYIEHLRRSWLIKRAQDIGATLADSGDAEAAKGDLMALESHRVSQTVSAGESFKDLLAELEGGAEKQCINTGLADLDHLLAGIEPGDLCVIAARPSMGKTALLLNIVANVAQPTVIFSLEMGTGQLLRRIVAAHGVEYGRLRGYGQLSDSDWPAVTRAMQSVTRQGVWINDAGGLEIGTIESESWRMVKGQGARMICVDYLQLVNCKAENRLETVSAVSRRLKALAKNLKVPVIALSQMNRAVETRGNPTPKMADLRESGQIEQDADQVIFIHRPEVSHKGDRKGEADLIVAKNRGGELGQVTVGWQGRFQRFVNFEPSSYPSIDEVAR